MAPGNPLHAREAGLRRLLLAKRWILAGSVTFTGLLAGLAANAFPGKTIKAAASTTAGERSAGGASSAYAEPSVEEGEAEALTPPAESPESSEAQELEEGYVPPPEEPIVSGGS
jgi:hypothetical protein